MVVVRKHSRMQEGDAIKHPLELRPAYGKQRDCWSPARVVVVLWKLGQGLVNFSGAERRSVGQEKLVIFSFAVVFCSSHRLNFEYYKLECIQTSC